MFRSHGEYKGHEITEVLGVTWIVTSPEGDRVNYEQSYFEDVYAVYRWIDKVVLNE